jgi:hypothetical protein
MLKLTLSSKILEKLFRLEDRWEAKPDSDGDSGGGGDGDK